MTWLRYRGPWHASTITRSEAVSMAASEAFGRERPRRDREAKGVGAPEHEGVEKGEEVVHKDNGARVAGKTASGR